MTMFTKFNVIKQLKSEIQNRLDQLPYEMSFELNENECVKLWLISKNETEFINNCLQSVISDFIMNEEPFCDYEISEQMSIIQEFYETIIKPQPAKS